MVTKQVTLNDILRPALEELIYNSCRDIKDGAWTAIDKVVIRNIAKQVDFFLQMKNQYF